MQKENGNLNGNTKFAVLLVYNTDGIITQNMNNETKTLYATLLGLHAFGFYFG